LLTTQPVNATTTTVVVIITIITFQAIPSVDFHSTHQCVTNTQHNTRESKKIGKDVKSRLMNNSRSVSSAKPLNRTTANASSHVRREEGIGDW